MVVRPILAEEISENPCRSGNREGLGEFAPIRMTAGIREKQRYPQEQPKDQEHHRQQASREKCQSIRKKSQSRKCEQKQWSLPPKTSDWEESTSEQDWRSAKMKRLFEGKGNSTDAQQNAGDPIKVFVCPCR
jgi:hypothetical protein